MEKLEKMISNINKKFDTRINMIRAGGRLMVTPEKGYVIDSKKMTDIREYLLMQSEELEDDNI